MKNSNNKRISFSVYDAMHLYEFARFYWHDHFKEYPEDRKILSKFGNCAECTIIGERLEKFIGKKVVREVEELLKKDI